MKKRLYDRYLLIVIVTSLIGVATVTQAGGFHGRHGMANPLEKMIDHVDLTEAQEAQVELILAPLREKGMRNPMRRFQALVALDPDNPEYNELVDQEADRIAEAVRAKVVETSRARKQIYDILTPEQKASIERVVEKKMKRFEKRMAKHHRE